MDATRYLGLARLLPVVMVTFVTIAPTLLAEESTLVFTDPRLDGNFAEEAAPNEPAASLTIVHEPAPLPRRLSQPQRVQASAAKPMPRPANSRYVEQTPPQRTTAPQIAAQLTRQPASSAARKTITRPVESVQQVNHEQRLPRQVKIEPVQPEEIDPAAEFLLEAHGLSQQAAAPEDFDEIIKLCQSAKRLGAEGEQLDFANNLMAWALNRRGQSRVDEGDKSLADADFEQALDLDPTNWRALHNRAVSYAQDGKFAEALDDFNRVAELNPLYAKAFANRATLFAQSGDLEVALDDYQRACRLDPKLLVAHVGLGRTYHLLGRREEALDAFNQALELDPESAEIVCSRADLLTDLGRYGEALADYARSIDLDPEFAHAYRNGSWLLATCPDPRYRDGANAVFGAERALKFGYGERHVALDTLAAAQASAGEFEKAIDTLMEAIKIAPYEARKAYRERLRMYESGEVFLTEPLTDIEQAVYEATDH